MRENVDRDIPVLVGPIHGHPRALEQSQRHGMRMAERVARTHADQRHSWVPCGQRLCAQPVLAAVMRDFEDVHVVQEPGLQHLPLSCCLGITHEHGREGTALYFENEARVVRLLGRRHACARPENAHFGATQRERSPRMQYDHRDVSTWREPSRRVPHARHERWGARA